MADSVEARFTVDFVGSGRDESHVDSRNQKVFNRSTYEVRR